MKIDLDKLEADISTVEQANVQEDVHDLLACGEEIDNIIGAARAYLAAQRAMAGG